MFLSCPVVSNDKVINDPEYDELMLFMTQLSNSMLEEIINIIVLSEAMLCIELLYIITSDK